jgi:hypothetical protein
MRNHQQMIKKATSISTQHKRCIMPKKAQAINHPSVKDPDTMSTYVLSNSPSFLRSPYYSRDLRALHGQRVGVIVKKFRGKLIGSVPGISGMFRMDDPLIFAS